MDSGLPVRPRRSLYVLLVVVVVVSVRGEDEPTGNLTAAMRARAFDRPACRRAISAARYETLWRRVCPEWYQQELVVGELDAKPVVIVRNQKVASTTMWNARLEYLFSDGSPTLTGYERNKHSRYAAPHVPPDDATVVAFVRAPDARLVAAYATISMRGGGRPARSHSGLLESMHPKRGSGAFFEMPCETNAQRVARFRTFLAEIASGTHLGNEAFHAWPQAVAIDVAPLRPRPPSFSRESEDTNRRASRATSASERRYDALGALERFDDGLAEVASMLGVPPPRKPQQKRAGARSHTHKCHLETGFPFGTTPTDVNTTRHFCELYEVDYVCFRYPAPQPCIDLIPDYARRFEHHQNNDEGETTPQFDFFRDDHLRNNDTP